MIRHDVLDAPAPVTPPIPTGGSSLATLADLFSRQYATYADGSPVIDTRTGVAVPVRTDGYFQAPWGDHDGGPVPVPSSFDWYLGATAQYPWPPGEQSTAPYGNHWGHGVLHSAEDRFDWVHSANPQVSLLSSAGAWSHPAYPNTDDFEWASWITSPFNEVATPSATLGTTSDGTAVIRTDFSAANLTNKYFLHNSSNRFYPRFPFGPCVAIDIQWYAWIEPHAGVSDDACYATAFGCGDRFVNANDSLALNASAWGGIGRGQRMSRVPRLSGYATLTPAQLEANPPPIMAQPTP